MFTFVLVVLSVLDFWFCTCFAISIQAAGVLTACLSWCESCKALLVLPFSIFRRSNNVFVILIKIYFLPQTTANFDSIQSNPWIRWLVSSPCATRPYHIEKHFDVLLICFDISQLLAYTCTSSSQSFLALLFALYCNPNPKYVIISK